MTEMGIFHQLLRSSSGSVVWISCNRIQREPVTAHTPTLVYNHFMPNILVTVLKQYRQPLYYMSWMLTAEKQQPARQLDAQGLDELLREKLSFDDDKIKKIMLDVEKHGKHIATHQVDDQTYRRLWG
jgi:hypothetical protein